MEPDMNHRPNNASVKIISFSGIDGSGKTTQIKRLCAGLSEAGLTYRLVGFWDDVARLTRFRESAGHAIFRGDKGVGSPSAPINRRDKNVRSWMLTSMRLCLYFLDALSARSAVRSALHYGVDVVLFDRFIYDELANLNLRNPFMRVYARLVESVTPGPHLRYLLDADPVQARARKPEYPVEFLVINRESYLTLNGLIGGMTVVPPMTVSQAESEVLKHASQCLSLDSIPRCSANPARPGSVICKLPKLESDGSGSAA
jgi:thymidylate kinase